MTAELEKAICDGAEGIRETQRRTRQAVDEQIRTITPTGLEDVATACIRKGMTLEESRQVLIEANDARKKKAGDLSDSEFKNALYHIGL